MHSLNTNDPISLSVLFNEELYLLKEDVVLQAEPIENKENKENESPVLEEPPIKKLEKPVFEYIGDNNKYILIVVNDMVQQFLNATELEFLLKILSAKKLELKDIAIINTESYEEVNFDDLKDYFAMSKILTFGINPASLKIEGIKANLAGEFKGVKVLGTWKLSQLAEDVNKKAIYWKQLKDF